MLLISNERLAERSIDDPDPLAPAPELAVEIVSKTEKQRSINEKVADYVAADVIEIWVVRSTEQTVEQVVVSAGEPAGRKIFGMADVVDSLSFPGLTIAVASIFHI